MTLPWPDTNSGELIGNGRYRLEEVIGTGGMATVHRAHDLVLDRDVAVKVFRDDVAEASDSRRIEAEMKLLGSVNHPSLVTLHDAAVSADGSTTYLVMELVDGTHLAKLIADGGVSSDDAAEIIAQVASALAHIHRKGIVHRDVKPANILVRRDDDGKLHAKLADLGIAQVADSTRLTTAGTILGTVAYLSPEQVSGGPLGPATDVYALGLVLLECITGKRPFPGTPAESAAMRTMQQPTPPFDIGPEYEILLASMTRIDPAARIDAAEVEATLRMGRAETGPTKLIPRESLMTATAPIAAPGSAPVDVPAATASHTAPTVASAPTTDTPASPIAEPRDEATQAFAAASLTSTGTQATAIEAPQRPSRRKWILVAVVLLLIVAAAIAYFVVTGAPSDPAPTPPPYPAVPGELGTLLDELQESVNP